MAESKGAGEFDIEVELAHRFHWTPEQISRLDPDFVDELIARMNADAEYAKSERKRKKHGKR